MSRDGFLRLLPPLATLLLSCVRVHVDGYATEKIWRPVSRFDDAAAWPDSALPTAGDTIVLPDARAVFWPGSVVVNADLVFGSSGVVVFHPSPAGSRSFLPLANLVGDDSKVKGKVVQFPATSGSWFDPRNWRFGLVWNSNPLGLIPVPEAERIPCPGDFVKFAGNATFRVELDADVSVRTLTIGSSAESVFRRKEDFVNFRRTSVGSVQFGGSGVVDFEDCSAAAPPSSKMCACGNSRPEVMAKICAFVSPAECESQTRFCEDPVRPVGSCCGVCGAVGTAAPSAAMAASWARSWARVEEVRDSALAKWSHLQAHAGVTHDGTLQVVAVDSEGNLERARQALAEIESALVTASLIEAPVMIAAQIASGGSGHPVLIVFGVLSLVVVCVLAALVCNKRRLPPSVSQHIPDVDFEVVSRFLERRGLAVGGARGGASTGGRDSPTTVSWARLRDRIGGGAVEEADFSPAPAPAGGSGGSVFVSNPIFEAAFAGGSVTSSRGGEAGGGRGKPESPSDSAQFSIHSSDGSFESEGNQHSNPLAMPGAAVDVEVDLLSH